MATIKMSAPWVVYYRELEALFGIDPEVHVIYDEEDNIVRLYVDNPTKAQALDELLPTEQTFGNVTLYITIIPSNGVEKLKKDISLYAAAFEGSPALAFVKTIKGIFSTDLNYVVFKNKVVQYFNDDLSDYYGVKSTLYQEIAKDIFGISENVFFCTDIEEPVYLGKPLGEWP